MRSSNLHRVRADQASCATGRAHEASRPLFHGGKTEKRSWQNSNLQSPASRLGTAGNWRVNHYATGPSDIFLLLNAVTPNLNEKSIISIVRTTQHLSDRKARERTRRSEGWGVAGDIVKKSEANDRENTGSPVTPENAGVGTTTGYQRCSWPSSPV
jgi:hypothetical protein